MPTPASVARQSRQKSGCARSRVCRPSGGSPTQSSSSSQAMGRGYRREGSRIPDARQRGEGGPVAQGTVRRRRRTGAGRPPLGARASPAPSGLVGLAVVALVATLALVRPPDERRPPERTEAERAAAPAPSIRIDTLRPEDAARERRRGGRERARSAGFGGGTDRLRGQAGTAARAPPSTSTARVTRRAGRLPPTRRCGASSPHSSARTRFL